MHDMVLTNGGILDGVSEQIVYGDIAICDGKIARVGRSISAASDVIDIQGMVVCPGFIDMHSHTDMTFMLNPKAESKVEQGVTTEVVGQCGISVAPTSSKYLEELERYSFSGSGIRHWDSFASYMARVDNLPLSTNIVHLVGQGTVRIAVMGLEAATPSKQQVHRMQELVKEALGAGVFGISSGLIYPPGEWSGFDELVAVLEPLAEFRNAFYSCHVRGEGRHVDKAWKEAIDIACAVGTSLEIAHAKVAGQSNWGLSKSCLGFVDAARADGHDVTFDCYPYLCTGGTLSTILPNWVKEGGASRMTEQLQSVSIRQRIVEDIAADTYTWNPIGYMASDPANWTNKWVYIREVEDPSHEDLVGKYVSEVAQDRNCRSIDVVFDILAAGDDAAISLSLMDDHDLVAFLQHDAGMIGSDGEGRSYQHASQVGKPHPRSFATFPRVLSEYAKNRSILTLGKAVQKMTGLPAKKLGLKDRGIIQEGYVADLVVFDPDAICDRSTYADPWQRAHGIRLVIIDGQIVVENGQACGVSAGKLLRREEG
jgi:N-acyl-D-aspartate/D-glutamate deacylase